MSEKNKHSMWINLLNWENLNSFAQILFKRKITKSDEEKAIQSLEAKVSSEFIIGMEITEIEEWVIKELGMLFKKDIEKEKIHDLYQTFLETGSFDDENQREQISKSNLESKIKEDLMKGGVDGMPNPEMLNAFLSNLQNQIGNNEENDEDPTGLAGLLNMFGGNVQGKKKKDDDKNSETFYI